MMLKMFNRRNQSVGEFRQIFPRMICSFVQKFAFLLFIWCSFQVSLAQNNADAYLQKLELSAALYPPENLLQTKSLVIYAVPEKMSLSEPPEWLFDMQTFFAEVGIDAVASLNTEKMLNLNGDFQPLPEWLLERGIKNLILMSAAEEEGPFLMLITPFNGKNSLYDKGEKAWARFTGDLEMVRNELGALYRTDRFARTNLLVNEYPEFFENTPDPGVVARSIPPQAATLKVAIKAEEQPSIGKSHWHRLRSSFLFEEEKLLKNAQNRNFMYTALAADTARTFELVAPETTYQSLRRDGYGYELYFLRAEEKTLYEWLPFPERPEPEGHIVYKFYLRNLRTNVIYLGTEWDAHPDWQTALNRFVAQMEKALFEKEGG